MSRPRGFVAYRPRGDAQALIDATRTVLGEYAAQLPLSLRQLFYVLVTRGIVGKTERDYERLGEIMNRARRGRLVPMDAFRDDGFRHDDPPGWTSVENFMFNVGRWVENFTLDRQSGQDMRLVVWCEAQGMVPQLERVAHAYSVPVYSSGGFDSLTVKHDMAKVFSESAEPVEVLHIGDHDPSGVHMFGALGEDIDAFIAHYGGAFRKDRLAVTPEQVTLYGLPTAPPKKTDRRKFTGLTTQAEALDPKTLADIVRLAIEERQDTETRQGRHRPRARRARSASRAAEDRLVTRRQPKRGPGRDFRALAALPPQRPLVLPAALDPAEAPAPDDGDVELYLRRDASAGPRVTLVASATFTRADALRRLAERLHDAADALDGGAS